MLEVSQLLGDSGNVAAQQRYLRFLNANYSSSSFLFVILGYFVVNEFVFPGFAVLSPTADCTTFNLLMYVTMTLRLVVLSLVVLIWFCKTSDGSPPFPWVSQRLIASLPVLQGLCPILMNIALATYIIYARSICAELVCPKVSECAESYATVGLKAFPMVAFMLLRDTSPTAILVSFLIGVLVHLVLVLAGGSHQEIMTFLAYTISAGILLYDSHRQNRAIFSLVSTLQNTLLHNEELAAQAQALELRAMIGNVAHDLKTPLTSCLSAAECMTSIIDSWQTTMDTAGDRGFLLKAAENMATLKKCLKSVEGMTSFMTMTINRCLDYTKACKGVKLVPKYETVCLHTKIDTIVQLINDMNSAINVIAHPWSEAICSHIITDRQWLMENLLCLLSNAVKYSNRGKVDLTVQLRENPLPHVGDSQQQVLRLEVQDTGIGLSEEAMEHLFAPFKQAQRLAGGTGLGLYSLAMRVEALHGQYGVSKRPDGAQGSLFWFTIPYRPDELSAVTEKVGSWEHGGNHHASRELSSLFCEVESSVGSSNVGGGSSEANALNMMVVDDSPLIVKMTSALLKQKGHVVTEKAANGADALEKLLSLYKPPNHNHAGIPPFDAVLMDLQMPVLDGIEAIRRLRAAEEDMRAAEASAYSEKSLELAVSHSVENAVGTRGGAYHQYIIAVSANSDSGTRQKALDAGADDFLAKPFTYSAFMKLMRK